MPVPCHARESGHPVITGVSIGHATAPKIEACVYWVPAFAGTTTAFVSRAVLMECGKSRLNVVAEIAPYRLF
jgi:hypothetical protein